MKDPFTQLWLKYCRKHSESTKKLSEADLRTFVIFGGRVFQQTIGTPMGTSCGSIIAESVVFADMTWLIVCYKHGDRP
jgi:hypothetical protein